MVEVSIKFWVDPNIVKAVSGINDTEEAINNELNWLIKSGFTVRNVNFQNDENLHYVLFSCNEWKDYSSMSLIGVFTRNGLNKQIRKEIKEGNMEFDGDFIDIGNKDIKDIDTLLRYGYIEEIVIDDADY